MRHRLRFPVAVLAVACAAVVSCGPVDTAPEGGGGFDVVETSISEIHQAMQDGRVTARQLVEAYVERIEAYDRRGPALNAIIEVNPLALERADEENGCLQFVPGSHRWGPLPSASFGGELDQVQAHLSDSQRAAFHPIQVHLKAGEASIHHSSTLHGSFANTTDRPRRSLVLNYMGPDTRCADSSIPLLKGCPLLEVGALIEGAFFPIALDRTRP